MLYIAYGSNLNKEQMKYRCPGSKCVGKGIIEGYELLFKGSYFNAHATIEPQEGAKVYVGVWEISEKDEVQLDFYEGWPNVYQKKELTAVLTDGREVKGMTYIMNEIQPINMPSSKYLKKVIKGYFDFDLPMEGLYGAYRNTKEFLFNDLDRIKNSQTLT